jgi:hypothetical protein
MRERPERPGPDASSKEIAEWMERDFEAALAEGIEESLKDNEDEEE